MTGETTFARTPVLRPPHDARLRRYHRSYRRRLRKMSKTSPRLGDLIYTFPGAAFALASGYGTPDARGATVALVKEGADLRTVAACLGLPYWLRLLPPEAFGEPLPPVPAIDGFDRQVGNLVPKAPDAAAMWLRWLIRAQAVGGDDFAVWLAGQRIYVADAGNTVPVTALAAYVWYSATPRSVAGGLITTPWQRSMRLKAASAATREWVGRIVFGYCRADIRSVEGWLRPHKVNGYRIVPLLDPDALRDEGNRMHNCVADYAHAVDAGRCFIYGIRRGNRSVATMEVVAGRGRKAPPVIAQLLAPHNEEAPDAVWSAARKWIGRQGPCPLPLAGGWAGARVDPERWEKVWTPYWQHRGGQPAIPVEATPAALAGLGRELADLGRIAKRSV